MVADIQTEHVSSLIKHLQGAYTINTQALHDAIAQRNAFSLLHLFSLVKVDVMLPRGTPFDSSVRERARQLSLIKGYQPIWVVSPEDVVLMRLAWYRDCEATADDQWNDLLGVLKVQAPTLDLTYLLHVPQTLNISDQHLFVPPTTRSEKLSEDEAWTTYIAALRERNRNLRALKEELAAAEL